MNHQGSIKERRHSVKRLKTIPIGLDLDFVHKKRTQGENVILAKVLTGENQINCHFRQWEDAIRII